MDKLCHIYERVLSHIEISRLPQGDCDLFRCRCAQIMHYDTLQHFARHCNSLQCTLTRCNVLQHGATHCNILQHAAALCNIRINARKIHFANTHSTTRTHLLTLYQTATHIEQSTHTPYNLINARSHPLTQIRTRTRRHRLTLSLTHIHTQTHTHTHTHILTHKVCCIGLTLHRLAALSLSHTHTHTHTHTQVHTLTHQV